MGRALWQTRMLIAEQGLSFWLWLAGPYVSPKTLIAFNSFMETLPKERKP